MKDKFIRKFMRLARQIGEDDNPCYSRHIGAIIVDPKSNSIRGTGYNGPAPGTPHTDSEEYLRNFFWSQLTLLEKIEINSKHFQLSNSDTLDSELCDRFVDKFAGRGICPRHLLSIKSGERSELCSCGHAERHAISNAACDIYGFVMFCWCTVPCIQCSDAIIQSGIKTVHCLDEILYHSVSPWLLECGGVEVIQHDKLHF